jgi:hypothetical protein
MEKPRPIVLAIPIMWTLFLVNAVALLSPLIVLFWSTDLPNVSGLAFVPMIAIGIQLALLAGLINRVSVGRNWARWTYGAIVILVILAALATRSSSWMFVLKLSFLAGNCAVLYLLFQPSASSWFKPPKEPQADVPTTT